MHTERAPTRAVLTAELGVTRATAGAVAAELEALGLIRVDARPGAAAGSQGRPSHKLAIAEDGPVALAAQVHADGFRAALVGLGGRIVATAPGCEVVDADPAKVLASVVTAGAELLRETGRRCVGAGLAVPSAVAEPEGLALNPLHLAWPAGAPVRDIFAEQVRAAGLDGPAFAANDVNLAALAEHRHGAGRGARDLLCVATGHRGVGGALVLDGRLHRGSSGLALEVGHLTVHPEGRPCHCGSRGCLDVETDPLAFLTAAGREPGPEVSLLQQSIDLVRHHYDDPGVRTATETLIDRLGLGLAGLVNILNPDRIILGGLHRTLSTPTPTASAPSWPTAACGARAAASPSCRAPSTTTAWSAPRNWRGSRCWTIRSGRSRRQCDRWRLSTPSRNRGAAHHRPARARTYLTDRSGYAYGLRCGQDQGIRSGRRTAVGP
ncbi:putative Bifunctional UDP-N-acetylglucosamine 2-epimerase-acetylmannosamine kinase [Streptomyces afghaniensis 772]|uniref:Putative Bifunctional UDP-N-acetylglucosamine 2-epimerase-acetylmannosamine kinase n=1 Tax=Streptomyces afghaniensis 772 TaxID=1283301 RepID=S4MNC9_9ACTN|nr:putative Bifunctional UDP-N-acetylglucosamine 2-epimerase-acetylmannosamine kinase [Streptomyces afghaniensis 772]